MEYITVKDYGEDSFVEKRSQFLGYCKPVSTAEEAQAFINEIKVKHRDATHNVWAYSLREGGIMRYSDDGEPQGTAGIPVLDVLKKSDTVDAVLVVTRYFGDIKLGGGGLVRAYSHGASIALKAATRIFMKQCIVATVSCEYSHYSKFSEYIESCDGIIDDTEFSSDVSLYFHILPENLEKLLPLVADLSRGKAEIIELEKEFHGFPIE